ncbi:hypothetical protein OJAV_G00093880 [Oryzias javanicus]|uniref:THD domain-containing protein n=1 Tax=Oryzias javanicus TaxID=123683 RepID=A0A3S2PAJ7_ORYJA|nr:hypothetical protein OJAV_G00093880 [Oryzias javanicus]
MSANRQLIYEGGADSMEQECICAEEGLRGVSAACRHRSGWRWLQRTAQLLVVALLLLLLVVLGLLVIVGLERNKPPHHDEQDRPLLDNHIETDGNQRQMEIPRAMLTVSDNQTSGLLQWETELGNTFSHGGFSYADGHLVVPRDGMYRVFLQVTFEFPLCEPENQPLSCTVLSWTEQYPDYIEILKTDDFVQHGNATTDRRKTLYTSALFRLTRNTKLKVETNQLSFVVKNERLGFFGAELLPD